MALARLLFLGALIAASTEAHANIECGKIYNDTNQMYEVLVALQRQVEPGAVVAMKCSAIQRSEQILAKMVQMYRSCNMEAAAINAETSLDQMNNERDFLYSQLGITCPAADPQPPLVSPQPPLVYPRPPLVNPKPPSDFENEQRD